MEEKNYPIYYALMPIREGGVEFRPRYHVICKCFLMEEVRDDRVHLHFYRVVFPYKIEKKGIAKNKEIDEKGIENVKTFTADEIFTDYATALLALDKQNFSDFYFQKEFIPVEELTELMPKLQKEDEEMKIKSLKISEILENISKEYVVSEFLPGEESKPDKQEHRRGLFHRRLK